MSNLEVNGKLVDVDSCNEDVESAFVDGYGMGGRFKL